MRNVLLALPLLLLCACSLGPDYTRPEMSAPEQWTVEYPVATEVVNTPWWQQLGDPILDGLIETAVRNNLDLRLASARVAQFHGAMKTTRSQYFPQFKFTYNLEKQRQQETTLESQQALLNATWEIDLWGRIGRANEAAQANILASEAGRRGVLTSLVTNVASAYLTLRGLDRQLEIIKASEQAYGESLRIFRARFQYGTVTRIEVSQAESLYEGARQAVPDYEAQIRQQENLLSLLLGRPPGHIPRGKSLDGMIPPDIPAGLPSELLEQRPDIIQAEQALIAANAEIGVAKAAYFPSISLTGALGVASKDFSRLFSSGSDVGSAGGLFLAPLLDSGTLSGAVNAAEARQQQALYQYQQAFLVGLREVEDALIQVTKRRGQLEAQKRQLLALEEYAYLSRLKFEAGASGYLQVLDAERSLINGRLTLTGTMLEVLTRVVAVYKSMGGGWISEADKLSSPQG